jgi:TRAP-type C4-dicarboxylate transport system permease small subunit
MCKSFESETEVLVSKGLWQRGEVHMKLEPTLGKFSRFVGLLTGCLETAGIFMLLVIFVVNCADIIGSNLFSFPFPGITEVVGFSHAIAIAFGLAITYKLRQHIRMEIVVDLFPEHVRSTVERIVSLFILALCVIITWEVFKLGRSFEAVGEVSGTLRLPIHYFAYGVAFGFLGICFVIVLEFLVSLYREQKTR